VSVTPLWRLQTLVSKSVVFHPHSSVSQPQSQLVCVGLEKGIKDGFRVGRGEREGAFVGKDGCGVGVDVGLGEGGSVG